jgi:hypothetical protein
MLKKISNFTIKELHWKILSLAIAFVLWLVVMDTQDPVSSLPIRVDVKIDNIDVLKNNGLVLANEAEILSETIQVTVRAKKSSLNNLIKYKKDFTASINLEDVDIKFGENW